MLLVAEQRHEVDAPRGALQARRALHQLLRDLGSAGSAGHHQRSRLIRHRNIHDHNRINIRVHIHINTHIHQLAMQLVSHPASHLEKTVPL